jgi:hypothetical protein
VFAGRHLDHRQWNSDQNDAYQVGGHKRSATVLTNHVREAPEIPESDDASD